MIYSYQTFHAGNDVIELLLQRLYLINQIEEAKPPIEFSSWSIINLKEVHHFSSHIPGRILSCQKVFVSCANYVTFYREEE